MLTVTTEYIRLESSSVEEGIYTYQNTNGVSFTGILNGVYSRANGECSHAVVDTRGANASVYPQGFIWIGVSNSRVYWLKILDVLGLTTIDEFKTWLDSQNVQLVYNISTPFTIQLPVQQITAISKTNTIYADSGVVTVSGLSDPIATIASLQSRVSALESAQTNM